MKEFLSSSKGSNVLGVVLAIVIFVILNAIFGLGGAIWGAIFGAIAGVVGFGAAGALRVALAPKEDSTREDSQ